MREVTSAAAPHLGPRVGELLAERVGVGHVLVAVHVVRALLDDEEELAIDRVVRVPGQGLGGPLDLRGPRRQDEVGHGL